MHTLLIITLAICAASADIGIGYNYKVPHTSYGVPSYQYAGSSGDYNTGYAGGGGAGNSQGSANKGSSYNQLNSGYQGLQSSNSGYQGQQSGTSGYQGIQSGNSGYQGQQSGTSGYQGLQSGNSGYQGQQSGTSGYQGLQSGSSGYQGLQSGSALGGADYQNGGAGQYFLAGASNSASSNANQFGSQYQNFHNYQYQTAAVHKYQQYYNQLNQQPAQVFKHFYVHAAPEEPEHPKPRQPLVLPPPQKHYKIIFIKAPTAPAPQPQFIPVPQQNEEKTIVYVLVNNPHEAQEIQLPKIEPKPPSKPEVFFIKYDTKDDQSVINHIVNDYHKVDSVGFATDGSGQYIGSQAGGSDQNVQSLGSGQYQSGGSLNSGAAGGLYTSGHNQQSGGSGEYTALGATGGTQGSPTISQVTSGSVIGSQALAGLVGGSGGEQFSSATADAGTVNAIAGSTNSFNFENVVSPSQQVPHETYGPPKFKE